MLGDLATRLRRAQPNFDALSQRNKAIAIGQFLRQNNLTGLTSERHYRDLKNNYISIALQDQKHHSLPLISVAIYCSLAQRLGLDARSCAFPSHVIAIIYPKNSESLDGPLSNSSRDVAEPMYLDPWRSDIEVPAEQLRTQLQEWGVASADFPRYMNDTSTRNLVIRTSRNILATFQEFRGGGDGANIPLHQPSVQLYSNPFADMDHAIYSALWANFLVNTPARAVPVEQLEFVPLILERFERLYSMDAIFMEQYLCPSSSSDARASHNWLALLETIRVVRAGDSMPKQVRRRDTELSQTKVLYRVGQVFQHKRYRYDAVITGWDVECTMNSTWIAANHVDTLSKGRHQSFYHVL
jgi:F-box protein 21